MERKIIALISFIAIALCLSLSSCASSNPSHKKASSGANGEELVERSHPQRPPWYFSTPSDDNTHTYLVGISKKRLDEQTATNDAGRNAASAFSKYCGVKVSFIESYVKRAQTQDTSATVRNKLTATTGGEQRSNAFISGLKAKARYFEKYKVQMGGSQAGFKYLVALLYQIPLGECDRIKLWQRSQKASLLMELEKLVADAKRYANRKEFRSAVDSLFEAEKQIKQSGIDPSEPEVGYQYSTVQTLKRKYRLRLWEGKIEKLVAEATGFSRKGDVVAALHALRLARETIQKVPAGEQKGKLDPMAIDLEEKKIIGNLKLIAASQVRQNIEPGEIPESLKVSLFFKTIGQTQSIPVGDIVVVFSSDQASISRRTDSYGMAEWRLSEPVSGNLRVKAAIDANALNREISEEALRGLALKQVQYEILVKVKTLGDKADELIKKLTSQIETSGSHSKPIILAIGSFKNKDNGCSNPFLANFRGLVNDKAVNHSLFQVTGPVRIPERFPRGLDPNLESDQAKILKSKILYARMSQFGEDLSLNAIITDSDNQLASTVISFNRQNIGRKTIARGCDENQSLMKKILPLSAVDFHFRLWTNHGGGTYNVGDTIEIFVQCSLRCFLKVFNVDEKGAVVVLEDTKKRRMLRNKKKSFKVRAVSPGVQSLIAIASSDPFPLNYSLNHEIKRAEFPIVFRQLRNAANSRAESKTTFTIVE